MAKTKNKAMTDGLRRREILTGIGASALTACGGGGRGGSGGGAGGGRAPAVVRSERDVPGIFDGVLAGDIGEDWAMVWGRSDRAAQMIVEWSAAGRTGRVTGPIVTPETGFTGLARLDDLPAGADVDYAVSFAEIHAKGSSAPVQGHLRTPPAEPRAIHLLWSGDTCGQGFGVGEPEGPQAVGSVGMRTYASMSGHDPDLMIHCGDLIYADNPVPQAMRLRDGTVWRNLVDPLRSKVAETLEEYRAAYLYNFRDGNFNRFHRQAATIFAWDDHEVRNNWYPGEVLGPDSPYTDPSVDRLAARGLQAFRENTPIAGPSIHRLIRYGPLLDIFVVDMRSFRGANSPGLERAGSKTSLLGQDQAAWLARSLAQSRALWKIVVADMPLGLMIGNQAAGDAYANGYVGPPLGRELELARLLGEIQRAGVRNLVWVTADVHYTAAHRYDPERAIFSGFEPFWEFVSGPLHAGTFGPNTLDPTFGPDLRYLRAPPPEQGNLPPSEGYQFFGQIQISAAGMMTVTLRDREDRALWSIDLPAGERL